MLRGKLKVVVQRCWHLPQVTKNCQLHKSFDNLRLSLTSPVSINPNLNLTRHLRVSGKIILGTMNTSVQVNGEENMSDSKLDTPCVDVVQKQDRDSSNGDTVLNVQNMADDALEEDIRCTSSKKSNNDDQKDATAQNPIDKSKMSRRAYKRLMRQRNAVKKTKSEKRKEKGTTPVLNFEESFLTETSYYSENGLRNVYPYYFTFSTYAKGRWVGQTVLDIFLTEFRNESKETYIKAIRSGQVLVNGKSVGEDYKFKDNDFMQNTVHRHEQPVTSDPIDVLVDNSDFLVINKPSSIPVHPCGRYRHNSVIYILAKEHGVRNLRTIYRLDRLTSGLLIFAKTEERCQQMMDAVKNRKVEKEYICRVQGEFPSEPVVCEEPLDVLCHKMGIFKVSAAGKAAKTSFHRLSYNGATSVVKCKPYTGRTHQIRIHLQWLGYPIVNDPLYNSEVWGPERGKGGRFNKSDEQLIDELLKHHSLAQYIEEDHRTGAKAADNDTAEGNSDVGTKEEPSNGCDSTHHSTESCDETPAKKMKLDESSGDTGPHIDNSAACDSMQPENDNLCDAKTRYNSFASVPSNSTNKDVSNFPIFQSTDITGSDSKDDKNVTGKVSDSTLLKDNRGSGSHIHVLDTSKLTVDENCAQCKLVFRDPNPQALVMYLHALRYKGADWDFSTPLPDWAREDWQEAQ